MIITRFKTAFISFVALVFSCSLWELSPQDYYSPVFESEMLVINGDTIDIANEDPLNRTTRIERYNSPFFTLTHLRLYIAVKGIPSMGETLYWSDTVDSAIMFRYKSINIARYSISITQIPFNNLLIGEVPAAKHELVDSVAFQIECNWDGNNKYTGQVHARKYVIYVTD